MWALLLAAVLLAVVPVPAHGGFQDAWALRKQLDVDYSLANSPPHYGSPKHRSHRKMIASLTRFMKTWMSGGTGLRAHEAATAFCRREGNRAAAAAAAAAAAVTGTPNALTGMSPRALGRACTWVDFNAALEHAIEATGGIIGAENRVLEKRMVEFEKGSGLLLRCAFCHVEAIQTIDM